jgi:type III restriction enzyme
MRELRLFSGYGILFGKVKSFIRDELFATPVNLEDLNTLRNLSEIEATRMIVDVFKKAINDLTVVDKGEAEIRDTIKIKHCRPFVVKDQGYLVPKKSPFNKIVCDSQFELEFATFLDSCEDIVSYAKNYFGVHFKIDYKTADGFISDYYPDFLVKVSEQEVWIIETKGREDLDDIEKIKRLRQWCVDINTTQKVQAFSVLYIRQDAWEKLPKHPSGFRELAQIFGKD